jgi:23S rRNA (cytosine1962-C5)-methyltransferase
MHVVLKPRRARPFFARHPWVFATSIARVEGEPGAGAEVDVISHEGKWVARGLFNPESAIRVRLYRWDEGPLDEPFWSQRIDAALHWRENGLGLGGDRAAYRVLFSESDSLSGLTADRYDRWLIVQFTSRALYERREALIRLLAEKTRAEGIAVRTERGIAELEGLRVDEGTTFGSMPGEPVEIVENGITYFVDLKTGHKTGFYLDQRDNRRAIIPYAKGRRVLDLFCYSGGFALSSTMHGGAVHALGVDSSTAAIELARQNAVFNRQSHVRFEAADVFEVLDRLRTVRESFGMVICDPPKFARTSRALGDALKGYLRLNRAAVDVLEPNGVLVTCSCSGHIDRNMFANLLGQVAELSGRPIQILEQRGQAPDHPVSASCLETDYLKCFICRVG